MKSKSNNKKQSCAAQRIALFTPFLNMLHIYGIYTVCVYFGHSYKNKIRYYQCPTIHTR